LHSGEEGAASKTLGLVGGATAVSQATFQHFLLESLVKMAMSVTPVFSNMNLEQNEEDALLNSPPNVLQVRQMYA